MRQWRCRVRIQGRKSGFTIIELLVVIVIVGILTGLLAQAVGRVKEKGRSIGCVSNMRQLGLGILMYADDQGGALPMATNFSVDKSSADRIWVTPISSYIHGRNVFICPSARRSSRFEPRWPGRGWISIGYNGVTAYDPRGIEGPTKKPTTNEVSDPSRTVLFADTPSGPTEMKYRGYVFSPFNGVRNFSDPRLSTPLVSDHDLIIRSDLRPGELKPVFARHLSLDEQPGRSNLVIADGHVESKRSSEILQQDKGANLIWIFR